MARKEDRSIVPDDGEVWQGSEEYRGHLLKKWLVTVASVSFWRVDIFPIGEDSFDPMAFAQEKCTSSMTLEHTMQAAKRFVGEMIFAGTEIAASHIPVDHLAKSTDPLGALNATTDSGKRFICPRHWSEVLSATASGDCNALVMTIKLTQRFHHALRENGIVVNADLMNDRYRWNLLLDSYVPLCCWLGDEVVAHLIAESDPKVLLAKAKEMRG